MSGQARQVSVFGVATWSAEAPEYAEALRLGRLLAAAGYRVCTGGYGGAMEAVSQGAHLAGGAVLGVTLAGDPRPANRWLTREQRSRDLHERLVYLLGSDAWIALSGGVGTLNEVALGWALLQKMPAPRPPLILVGARWQHAIAGLAGTLRVGLDDPALLTFAPTVEAALAALPPAQQEAADATAFS